MRNCVVLFNGYFTMKSLIIIQYNEYYKCCRLVAIVSISYTLSLKQRISCICIFFLVMALSILLHMFSKYTIHFTASVVKYLVHILIGS